MNADPARFTDRNRFNSRAIVRAPLPTQWESTGWPVKFVSRIDRLTELRYITGLRRGWIDPEMGDQIEQPIDRRSGADRYGIARHHFGEGIYFEVKPEWILSHANNRQQTLKNINHVNMTLSMNHLRNDIKTQLPSLIGNGEAGNHLTIIHTLSHLLIRELCVISGYSLGSIRERLYLHHDDGGNLTQAGILLYTSGPSSDGTLGGLAGQGTQDLVTHLIERALSALDMCSNDPVCWNHEPIGLEKNGAACHACLYLPETSCEMGNLMLDRRWA